MYVLVVASVYSSVAKHSSYFSGAGDSDGDVFERVTIVLKKLANLFYTFLEISCTILDQNRNILIKLMGNLTTRATHHGRP